jgi:hypothetical protein
LAAHPVPQTKVLILWLKGAIIMAAAKRSNASRKSHATQARGQASGKKRRGGARAQSRTQQREASEEGQRWSRAGERAYAYGEENMASFARGAERAAHALQSDIAAPVGEGLEQIMRSWMGFFQRAALTQQRLVQDMLELGSGRRAFEAQRTFIDESLRNFTDSTKEVLHASGRIAEPAVRTAQRAAGLVHSYGDHEQAQRRTGGNGRSAFGERREQESARR